MNTFAAKLNEKDKHKSYANQTGHTREAGAEQLKEVALCVEWIQTFCELSRTPHKSTSYGLKHRVEAWAKTYIGNESFKAAVALLGIRSTGDLNWNVYIKEKKPAKTVM